MKEEQEKKIREAMSSISDATNRGVAGEEMGEILADEFMRDHRTLQQSMTRVLYHFFKKVAEKNRSDLRNEASMKWITKIAEEEAHFPFV